MPKGGSLTIQTVMSENYVSLIVEDTGTGISDEVKKQMFIPFFSLFSFFFHLELISSALPFLLHK